MSDVDYELKDFSEYAATANSAVARGRSFDKIQNCPHCGKGTDAVYRDGKTFHYQSGILVVFIWKCTSCKKLFLTLHTVSNDTGESRFELVFPRLLVKRFHRLIEEHFPRFVELYNQAFTAEQEGLYDLAGIGYRAALEVLVKDYAMQEMSADKSAKESKLHRVIGEFLNADELVAADVVKEIGNDYAHYERKLTDLDLDDQKEYFDIFISQVLSRMKIAHPPVRRKS